jgi:hypothetical protein
MKATHDLQSNEEPSMTDREQLLQEIQQAPDDLIAETLKFLRSKARQSASDSSQSAIAELQSQLPQTPEERVKRLREWVASLPKNDTPLPEEALHRDSMYD